MFSTGPAALLLVYAHTSDDDSRSQTLTRSTLHQALSQRHLISGLVPLKESVCGHIEMLAWPSSHNRKHLKPAEQMSGEDLRGSLRPGAVNQALSAAAVRVRVMITAHDK